jgi:hypothetical protein
MDSAPDVVVGLHSLVHGGLPFVEQEVACSNYLAVGGGAESAGDEGVQSAVDFLPGTWVVFASFGRKFLLRMDNIGQERLF